MDNKDQNKINIFKSIYYTSASFALFFLGYGFGAGMWVTSITGAFKLEYFFNSGMGLAAFGFIMISFAFGTAISIKLEKLFWY